MVFCPGDLQEKVDPYLRPLNDALIEMLGQESYHRYVERGSIEVAPLAYMRGRTLDDSFIILDEAPEHHAGADEDVRHPVWVLLQGRHHGRHHSDRPAPPIPSPV